MAGEGLSCWDTHPRGLGTRGKAGDVGHGARTSERPGGGIKTGLPGVEGPVPQRPEQAKPGPTARPPGRGGTRGRARAGNGPRTARRDEGEPGDRAASPPAHRAGPAARFEPSRARPAAPSPPPSSAPGADPVPSQPGAGRWRRRGWGRDRPAGGREDGGGRSGRAGFTAVPLRRVRGARAARCLRAPRRLWEPAEVPLAFPFSLLPPSSPRVRPPCPAEGATWAASSFPRGGQRHRAIVSWGREEPGRGWQLRW